MKAEIYLIALKSKAEKRSIIPCSQKGKLKGGISSPVVKKVSWNKRYHPL
jgi:hypothetical protein